ncbi:hypothetical protein BC828DRAFT_373799 [Blastocladiella britannica]|nr:hypothetical protein BC828DRAFT_373799 [Blastocladiella britannica]
MDAPPAAFPTADMSPPDRQKSFAADISVSETKHGFYEGMLSTIGSVVGFFGSIPCCFICPNPYRTIDQGEVGLVTRFGKCERVVDPGLTFINLATDRLYKVDIKLQVVELRRQVVLTKDNVSIEIDSVLYFRVIDPYVAKFMVANVTSALMERAQTTLRQIFGMRTLQECIELRETIAHELESMISGPARGWGIAIENVLIKDLILSSDLLESLSAAAKQKRIGESKVIAAEAEIQAAQLMRRAADILASDAAMNIRYLETMAQMAKSANSKVIFVPMPASGQGASAVMDGMTEQMKIQQALA